MLLLSRTPAYEYLTNVLIAEVTSTIRNIPQEVRLGRAEGLRRASVANLDAMHVVPKDHLGALVGTVAPLREREVKRALGYVLGWPELQVL